MGKSYKWNEEKNAWLLETRGISFEQVIDHIERGDLIEILQHHNQERYPGQRYYAVKINDYVYLVPFVEEDAYIFLKTIIPNRKATRRHLR